MTKPDFRALCAELLEALKGWSPHGGGPLEYWESEKEALLMARAENALAQPDPVAPTRKEAVDLYSEVMAAHDCQTLGEMAEHFARAVLAKWGHQ